VTGMLKKERRNNAGRPIAGSLLSMKFVDNVLTVLGQCFDLAVKERPALLEVNPAKEIQLPKHDRREMFFLDDAAAYAALRGAMNAHFQPLLDFLVGTGARYGEAAGLWVQHLRLDAERPYVDIRAALKWSGKKRKRGRPKTRSSIRRILLPPRLVEVLRR
jgi:integrase